MRLRSRVLGGVVAAAAVVLAICVAGAGGAADTPAIGTAVVADAAPAYAVENFAYPQADKILAEQGIVLKHGNGHITWAACGPAGLLEVRSRDHDPVCFKVTGTEGYLSLEMPSVYLIRTGNQSGTAKMTADGETNSFAFAENSSTAVGESADPEGREHVLVELFTAS
jgi:hypothetical protein